MAEMEVIPQEKMANPQGMKVFAVERPGLPENFVSFPALCGVQSSPVVFAPNLPVTKMRLNVCFNEMALFGPFAALVKGCSSYGRNGGYPSREDG